MSVELGMNGQRYTEFERISVQRSILQAAGACQLTYSSADNAIAPDDAFSLRLDGHKALSGYIDKLEQRLSSSRHDCSAQGRDRTADLVDCSAQIGGKTGQLNGLRLNELAAKLAGAYNVAVKVAAGVKLGDKFPSWSLSPGETVWASIEKACRQRGVLAISDGQGQLLLTSAGHEQHPCALVEGGNVLQASYTQDNQHRYHHYICLGQASSADSGQFDQWAPVQPSPTSTTQPRASATDKGARSPRTLIVVNGHNGTRDDLIDRVNWELGVRQGKSHKLRIDVAGFSARGQLWQPNQLVHVDLPSLGVSDDWLLVQLQQTLDERGERSSLTLMPPDAFKQKPRVVPSTDSDDFSGMWGAQP